ncbi:putative aminotransferase family protein (LolT) [Aspergillus ruber CBS 135680]|uniref:Putative aminotransferase n=1 Tax=Aspergillus ruber (strain CBS 135680) TaxID=1388766 RepID=A0A017SLD9_ASPRC|nr:putative aminotransferase [Aspergillus ruber CBS 135680]EYE97798.1 putative aminotransferase [Aspergillus ruber CBS 135680]
MSFPTPFGAPMLKHFSFSPNFKNLNHGSFGTHPLLVRHALHNLQSEAESRPDLFIRRTTPQALDSSRQEVASLLHVPKNEVVLVKNATTGVHTVLHNMGFKKGDAVVYFDTVYGAVERMLFSTVEMTGVTLKKVQYRLPLHPEELVEKFMDAVRAAREEGLNVRVAVFETIVSMPGVRFPFERLVEVCRAEGVLSLIDGAHGIGHIPLDLGTLQPDFFTSNCHKWLYTPRGCAVLYVPVRHQHLIRTTLPTSWGYIPTPGSAGIGASTMQTAGGGKSAFESLFEFVATTDDTPYLCIPTAIKFRRETCGGDEQIFTYLEELANEAADIVAGELGTEVMQEPGIRHWRESLLRKCAMTTIRLPIPIQDGTDLSADAGKKRVCMPLPADEVQGVCRWMQDTLVDGFDTFLPVFPHGGWLWTRLSAQVYLEKSDFKWVAPILRELCEQVGKKHQPEARL